MQAAGDLVAAAAELAAGVQDGQHDRHRGDALDRVDVDRDAAAVVDDLDAAVLQDRHDDAVAVAGQRLVDGVVDDLPDQVVQAALTGGADVHAGPLADRLEPLEDLDRGGVVRRDGRGSRAAGGGRDRLFGHGPSSAGVCARRRSSRPGPWRGTTSPSILSRSGPETEVRGLADWRRTWGKLLDSRPPRASQQARTGGVVSPHTGDEASSAALTAAPGRRSIRQPVVSRRCRGARGRRGPTAALASSSGRSGPGRR